MKENKNLLIYSMIIGFILGILSGVFTPQIALKLKFLGTIFLNALKMVVLPLIILAILNSILKIGSVFALGKLGGKTFMYYIITTAFSVSIGIIIAVIFRPGEGMEHLVGGIPDIIKGKEKIGIIEILISLIPENIFKALSEFKVLPLIITSLIFGTALLITTEGKGVIPEIIEKLEKTVMLVVDWIIYFSPVGIFAIVGEKIAISGGDFFNLLKGLSKYVFVLLSSLSLHAIFVLPIIYFVFVRKNPYLYMNKVREALLMAFTTASSAATLPLTRKNVIQNGKSREDITDFVLPLGATVNMDGTALYEGVAVVFICQAYGIDLNIISYFVIFITAILAGIGAAAIPQAGLITMVIVLKSVGAPIEGIGLLLSIDWLMDRFRTAVNVWGDTVGVKVIEKIIE